MSDAAPAWLRPGAFVLIREGPHAGRTGIVMGEIGDSEADARRLNALPPGHVAVRADGTDGIERLIIAISGLDPDVSAALRHSTSIIGPELHSILQEKHGTPIGFILMLFGFQDETDATSQFDFSFVSNTPMPVLIQTIERWLTAVKAAAAKGGN